MLDLTPPKGGSYAARGVDWGPCNPTIVLRGPGGAQIRPGGVCVKNQLKS